MTHSWKPEVETGDGIWTGNALRFATKEEADNYLRDLQCRWTTVRSTRAVQCDLPVNYVWADGKAVYLESWKELREREIYDRNPELLK